MKITRHCTAMAVILLGLVGSAAVALHAAGVSSAGIGPKAVEPFKLERPQQTEDSETAKLRNPFKGIRLPEGGLLRPSGDGRVQLYSIAQLNEQDLANPFEIRVQVIVDMKETVFEIGGIIEGTEESRNTVILLTRAPEIRRAGQDTSTADPKAAKKQTKEERIPLVCSVGDTVEGFKILAIGRQSILLEQSGKYIEVTRGLPVTVCVPLSSSM